MAKIFKIGKFNRLTDAGYTLEEQATIYDDDLMFVFLHPRQVLDSLDKFATYRVGWHNYKHKTPVLPFKYVQKAKPL